MKLWQKWWFWLILWLAFVQVIYLVHYVVDAKKTPVKNNSNSFAAGDCPSGSQC